MKLDGYTLQAIGEAALYVFDDTRHPVVIHGGPASGKTTVRKALEKILGADLSTTIFPTIDAAFRASKQPDGQSNYLGPMIPMPGTSKKPFIIFEDFDSYPTPMNWTEGDIITMARQRLATFLNGKVIVFCREPIAIPGARYVNLGDCAVYERTRERREVA